MAKHPHKDDIERLRKAHADAAEKVIEILEDTIRAADTAVSVGDGDTRKLFKKQEPKVIKASDRWRQAAKDLAKHLHKKKT